MTKLFQTYAESVASKDVNFRQLAIKYGLKDDRGRIFYKAPDVLKLSKNRDTDYKHLAEILADGQWEKVDRFTHELMVNMMGLDYSDVTIYDDFKNFPITHLKKIDELWVRHSQGRFGFSVQRSIYYDVSGDLDAKYYDQEAWHQFGERVGWQSKNTEGKWISIWRKNFSSDAPAGHLPWAWGDWQDWYELLKKIA